MKKALNFILIILFVFTITIVESYNKNEGNQQLLCEITFPINGQEITLGDNGII